MLFDVLALGEVKSARQVHWGACGQVLNAFRALHHLGAECKRLTLVGGGTGEAIRRHIAELGIASRWIESSTPTRVRTTLLDRSRRRAKVVLPVGTVSSCSGTDSDPRIGIRRETG